MFAKRSKFRGYIGPVQRRWNRRISLGSCCALAARPIRTRFFRATRLAQARLLRSDRSHLVTGLSRAWRLSKHNRCLLGVKGASRYKPELSTLQYYVADKQRSCLVLLPIVRLAKQGHWHGSKQPDNSESRGRPGPHLQATLGQHVTKSGEPTRPIVEIMRYQKRRTIQFPFM